MPTSSTRSALLAPPARTRTRISRRSVGHGEGSHLCFGRNFAFAEILGHISVLVLEYDVEGLRTDQVKMGPWVLASAMPKPTRTGTGVRSRSGGDGAGRMCSGALRADVQGLICKAALPRARHVPYLLIKH